MFTCKTETHGEPVFAVASCCQSYGMGHGQNPNLETHMSRVSCQKGPARHAYVWQIGPFRQDTFDVSIDGL